MGKGLSLARRGWSALWVAIVCWAPCMAAGAGAEQAPGCPAGVDPAYCGIAAATGGAVFACDAKAKGPQACSKEMAEAMSARARHESLDRQALQRAAAESSARERRAWLDALPPDQAREMELAEELRRRRAAWELRGGWVAGTGFLAALCAFGAWIFALGRPWAKTAAMALGLCAAACNSGAWMAAGLFPLKGLAMTTSSLILFGLPAMALAGAAWGLSVHWDGGAPSFWSRALAALAALAGLALGCLSWVFIAMASIH